MEGTINILGGGSGDFSNKDDEQNVTTTQN